MARIVTVELFKEVSEGIWTMGSKQEYVINKHQPKAEFTELGN